jgi:hypothetical protein
MPNGLERSGPAQGTFCAELAECRLPHERNKRGSSKWLGSAGTQSCAVGSWVRGNLPLEPNRSIDQSGRNLMDLVGHRHFGRCRDASSLGCFTELGRLKERRGLAASSNSARR